MSKARNLLLHVEFGEHLIVVLGDPIFIERFTRAREFKIVMDGTFKTSSSSFYQIYIIHCSFSGQSFPLLYCFLNRKTEVVYTRILEIIKARLNESDINFEQQFVQIDFEQATFNAIRSVFPSSRIGGCYFHFGQALWSRAQRLGLTSFFNTDANFKSCVQLCSALPLISIADIDFAWEYITDRLPIDNPLAVELRDYIFFTWLYNQDESLFSRETWNKFENLRGRTNNAAEGFHHKLNLSLNKPNP
ncbi:hypothetical protein DMUE_2097, partial [Dictyocoela muelleri]